jgi:hypothetical protein
MEVLADTFSKMDSDADMDQIRNRDSVFPQRSDPDLGSGSGLNPTGSPTVIQ